MAKPGIPAFAAPVVKAPEPLLCCGSRQADQPAMPMTPCSAARPFVAKKTAEQVPRISASPLAGSAVQAARRWRWAPPAGARCPQPALPLLHTGNLPCCTSSGPRAHGCAEAGAHQPPRRRNSAVRGGSCRSAGQYWRAPRPVSPGTATLMADARCARRSADTLNELRPLRPTCQPGGRHLPTRCHWLPALFGPLLPAVCSPMPPAGAALLLADNPPSTHLTNPEPLDGARHEVSAVRVRPSPPNPTLAQPLLVRFCSR